MHSQPLDKEAENALLQIHHAKNEDCPDPERPVFIVRTDDIFQQDKNRCASVRPETFSASERKNSRKNRMLQMKQLDLMMGVACLPGYRLNKYGQKTHRRCTYSNYYEND